MDKRSIKELEILHEVSKSERLSQRYLSKKLGISSGLVNLYLKRLAHKGYIKVTGIKPRRLKYLLTPSGVAEKTRLTYEFALVSYKYYKSATEGIRKKLNELQSGSHKTVVILGKGELAELCLLLIKEFDIRIVAVVDDETESGRFLGYPVVPRELLNNLQFDTIIAARMDGEQEVESLVNEIGLEPERICRLWEAIAD